MNRVECPRFSIACRFRESVMRLRAIRPDSGESVNPGQKVMQAQNCYHAFMPTQLTIRGVTDELNRRLTKLGKSKGQSVNTVALSILEDAVGIDARRQRLDRYMTWSSADLKDFEAALKDQRVIDDELWS